MDFLHFVLNVGAAFLMGMAIGLERQYHQHPAGLRTNALVCVGAALFVSLSRLLLPEGSPTRIAAQVVSGIGFLGGGVILREGLNVKGLNTAATLWCSAAVGTLAGAGFPLHGLVGAAAVLGLHLGLRPLSRRIDARIRTAVDVETVYQMARGLPREAGGSDPHDPAAARRLPPEDDDPADLDPGRRAGRPGGGGGRYLLGGAG